MQATGAALDNIRENCDGLFASEKIVALYILENFQRVPELNVKDLAVACGVSEATVIRMCKHLGYKGYFQLKLMLAEDLGQNKMMGMPSSGKEIDSLDDFLKGISSNLFTIGKNIDVEVFQECVSLIAKSNVVHLIALGNTIPPVLDFAFRLGRIEIATTSSISDEQELSSINLARYGDIVIGVSHSGGSRSVLKAFQLAKQKGITTIAITDIIHTPLEKLADYTLSTGVEVSPVDIFGAESHVNLITILDALFFFLAKEKRTQKGLELFLAETQIEDASD